MTIFYGCKLYDKSRNYVGDSHDIHHFISYFWTYNELQDDLNSSFDEKKQRTLKSDYEVIQLAKNWLQRHKISE